MSSVKYNFKQAPITFILGFANVAVFLGLSFIGMTEDGQFMLEHGAMYMPYILGYGEYYRIFTSMFLHFGVNHLVNNMISLFLFGINLEKEIGSVKFSVIYLGSGLLANILSGWYDIRTAHYVVSAGASGAIFGIIGALLYVAIRNKGRIGSISGQGLVVMILFSLYYGFTGVGVDNMAHVGGLIFGCLLGVTFYHKKKHKYRRESDER